MTAAVELLQQLDHAIAASAPEERPALIVGLAARMATLGAGLTTPQPATVEATSVNITIKDAARRLGVSADYIYRNADKLPFLVRIGRRLLANSSALERYIKARISR